jgi:glycine/D-amino acid oxidase-like deaminating enzyme
MVTEPLDDAVAARVTWPERAGLVEARDFITAGRFTADNRILWAGGDAPYFFGRDMDDRHMSHRRVEQELRESFALFFPQWRDVRFDYAYGGCVAITRDLVPHVGALGGGIYHGYGYCGNGIATCHTAAKALRDLVLDQDSTYRNLLFVNGREPRFPPEPLSFLAARGFSRLLRVRERRGAAAGSGSTATTADREVRTT